MLNDVSGEANCKVHANYKYADSLSWAVTLPRKRSVRLTYDKQHIYLPLLIFYHIYNCAFRYVCVISGILVCFAVFRYFLVFIWTG